jgi:hypothetical protein
MLFPGIELPGDAIMELGLTALFLGVTGASLLPLALIGGIQALWRTMMASR